MSLVYIDTETTGLDPSKHQVWEIAYAVDGGPISSAVVPHSAVSADDEALKIGRYIERGGDSARGLHQFDRDVHDALYGNTLVAANPAFDAAFLAARWGWRPWKYRLFDIEAYAMGALGYVVPQGLKTVTTDLRDRGYDIPEPDHTAHGDVATLRACHLALVEEYIS